MASLQAWNFLPEATPSPELRRAVGGHPLVARLLAQRGYETPAKALPFLNPDLYQPASPAALTGVEQAATLLHDAIRRGQNLLVWGDFDVDGQTSTALLVNALNDLAGEERVRFHVPNRFAESHGIRLEFLQRKLAASDIPIHLLISCDTGITEAESITWAKEQGLTVVITDHHDLPAELKMLSPGNDRLWGLAAAEVDGPSVRRADVLVNPKFQPPGDPLRTLPGVGVAYMLAQQLFALAGRAGEEERLLDLVALGVVADVAEQVNDARYLLQRGLEVLRTTRRTGLQALMNNARINPAALTAESIGFQLGPRMNALGRLDDATDSVELLSTRDALRAGELAAKLERLNQQRRLLTAQTLSAASTMLEAHPELLEFNALVLAHEGWHAGVVGIVASKLVEQYGKPTVLLLKPAGALASGSARTANGVDIGASIAACAPLLVGYGGHPGAAGVRLLPDQIDAFRRELSRQVELHRDAGAITGLRIDATLAFDELAIEVAEELSRLAPFGQGNPQPQFCTGGLIVSDDRRLGREGTHRKLMVRPAHTPDTPAREVIWFHGVDETLPTGPLDLVYTLGINEFQGRRGLQMQFVAVRAAGEPAPATPAGEDAAAKPALIDLRNRVLHATDLPENAVWYAEGATLSTPDLDAALPAIVYAPRFEAIRAATGQPLVLWSAPPSPDVLQLLVAALHPSEVRIVARATADDSVGDVIRSVAKLCNFALKQGGRVHLTRAAARLATTEAVVRLALLWLESRGDIVVAGWHDGETALIEDKGRTDPKWALDPVLAEVRKAELEAHLAEVRAYRRFVQRVRAIHELGI
jgi:single-stranded-DNA-specific exonuclease